MLLRSILFLLFSLIVSSTQSTGVTQQTNTSVNAQGHIESKLIDQDWEDRILEISNAFYLLNKTMVGASKFDLSLSRYSPGVQFHLIKYPDSIRATMLQISNEIYRSFLAVHTIANRIHLYSEQIPTSIKLLTNLVDSQHSKALIHVQSNTLTKQITRIRTTMASLIEESTKSFDDVKKLFNEVLEVTNTFEIKPMTKSSDQFQPTDINKIIKKKPKRQRKGKSKKGLKKPMNNTDDGSATCGTLPENPNENIILIINTTKAFLSVSESYSDGRFPIPKSHDFFKILSNFTDFMDNASDDWTNQFHEMSRTLLEQSFSLSILSKTYYTISQKIIMPRLARSSLMLTASTDDARQALLTRSCADRSLVQNEIKMFINEQRQTKIQHV